MPFRPLLSLVVLMSFAASAAAQERQWSLDAGDQDAYLIFGVPDTDDVGISLWCPVRQGEVNVFIPEAGDALRPGEDVTITFRVGGESAEFKGNTEVNEEAGSVSAEVKIKADHPLFAAMLGADRFRVKVGEEENVFPLFDADVVGLLDLCRK